MVEEDGKVWLERIVAISSNLNNAAAKFSSVDEDVRHFKEELNEELENFNTIKWRLGTVAYEEHLRRRLAQAEKLMGQVANSHESIKLELKNAQFMIMRSRAKAEMPEEEEK
jgi:hypothetical protein